MRLNDLSLEAGVALAAAMNTSGVTTLMMSLNDFGIETDAQRPAVEEKLRAAVSKVGAKLDLDFDDIGTTPESELVRRSKGR